MAVLPKNNSNRNTSRPIFFELKNGKTVQMLTDLSWNQMNKIVDTVNMLTKRSN